MDNPPGRKRFLVVEDEPMIAMLLEDYLDELGYEVGWSVDTVDAALRLVSRELAIEAAILDVNVRGQSIRPVADALKARGAPFCFTTGYGAGVDTGHPDAPLIGKPFDLEAMRRVLTVLVG
jgi:DNA-binding response OmpR family regulator